MTIFLCVGLSNKSVELQLHVRCCSFEPDITGSLHFGQLLSRLQSYVWWEVDTESGWIAATGDLGGNRFSGPILSACLGELAIHVLLDLSVTLDTVGHVVLWTLI